MNQKKFKYITVITCVSILLGGCTALKGDTSQVSRLEDRVSELEQQVSDLQDQVNGMDISEAGVVGEEASGQIDSGIVLLNQEKSKKVQQLILGDTVSVPGNGAFTFDSFSWEDDVKPTNAKKAASGLEDKKDATYLVIRGTYKNLSDRTILDVKNQIQGMLVTDTLYSCGIKMLCEDKDGKSFNGMSNPDETLNMTIYASVSDKLLKQFQMGKMIFYLPGSDLKYQMSLSNSKSQ